jgi:hypothetical protein
MSHVEVLLQTTVRRVTTLWCPSAPVIAQSVTMCKVFRAIRGRFLEISGRRSGAMNAIHE